MRVFLDTNVLVAAYATHGLCEDVFRVILAEHELGGRIRNEDDFRQTGVPVFNPWMG